MKNRSVNILLVALCLFSVVSIMLIVFLGKAHDDFKENVRINADGVTEKTLTVKNLKLTPTEKKEYEILLTCAASGGYDIVLDYEETNDGGMKSYVDVTVKCNNQNVYEGSLTALLDEDKLVEFNGTLESDEPLVITICYEMPKDVGNEAQGTSSDFKVHLKVEKN